MTFPYKHAKFGDIVPLILPQDGQTAANTGNIINVREYGRVLLMLTKNVGTAGDDPVFTPLQHDAISGGNSKAIPITKIWSKLGATLDNLTGWTENTQSAGATYTDATSAELAGMIALEIDTADLDGDNGYNFVSLDIPDVGSNAQILCAHAVLLDKRYEGVATDVVTS